MIAPEVHRQALLSTQVYLDLLRHFSAEEFQHQPRPSVWSYAEVYSHIVQVNTYALMAIEKCRYGKPVSFGYRLPLVSRIVFFFGRFPGRLKAPGKVAAQVKKISLEEARNGLIKIKHRLEELLPKLAKINSDCRVNHPRLGMLNSEQWLRFITIHNQHHLKQIQRIKKWATSSSS